MDRRDILRNAGCSLAALFTVDVLALGNKEGETSKVRRPRGLPLL